MAEQDKNTNDNFTGFRYLMDAKNPSRQYALKFEDGVPKLPLHLFNRFDPMDKLRPGETVYAFGDEREFNNGSITAQAYKITAKPLDGTDQQKYSIGYRTVTYNEQVVVDRTLYYLTQESKDDLANTDDGDVTGLPARFESSDAGSIPLRGIKAMGVRNAIADAIAQGKVIPAKSALPPRPIEAFPTPPVKKYVPPYRPDSSWKVSDAQLEAALKPYSTDLTAKARAGKLDPVIGREKETEASLRVLNRRTQSSLCYTGEAGVGKTAMFGALAQHLVDNSENLPAKLQDAIVMELNIAAMVSGAKFRGVFEERLQPIVDGIMERGGTFKGKKLILAIDELHSQLAAGAAEGAGNAGELMKKMLTTEGVSIISATTDDEYRKYIKSNSANARRYEKMRLEEPDEAMTLAIIKKLFTLTKRDNNLTEDLSDEMLQYIYTMCNRYAPQEAHPSKDVKVLNTAGSTAELAGRTAINKDDVIAAISQMSGLTVEFLSQNDSDRFEKMEEVLTQKILGQDEAIRFITDNLISARAGMKDPKKPWGTFVLQGPPGTGKTQTAKYIAEYLFGDEENIIKLDMGEYMDKHTASRLIGSPPGYVGYDTADTFAERVRQKPYSVVLLDEIEKAHPDVLNIFLSIFNDGKLTDARGNTTLFNNVIFLATSNAGSAAVMKILEGKDSGMKFGAAAGNNVEKERDEKIAKIYAEAIKTKPDGMPGGGSFKPEMISRVKAQGGFVIFNPLSRDAIDLLVTEQVSKANARLSSADGAGVSNVKIELSEPVRQQIADAGYTPAMGARELEGAANQMLINPFSKWLMRNKEEIEAFVAKNGPAKIVINSLEKFEPVLVKAKPPVVVANDDVPANRIPAWKKAGGSPSPKP